MPFQLIRTNVRRPACFDLCYGRGQDSALTPIVLGDSLEGEARDLGIAKSTLPHGLLVKTPAVLLSGGETTVTLGAAKGGRGGRNTEFLLSFGLAMAGKNKAYALAADTDGIDGSETAAGAWITPDILRSIEHDQSAAARLENHDSFSFFLGTETLLLTGPTRTNVNDFRAVLLL